VKLVQNDKPGRSLTLDITRSGKPEKFKVALGEHHQAATGEEQEQLMRGMDRRVRGSQASVFSSQVLFGKH
jgi:hypothetical protein